MARTLNTPFIWNNRPVRIDTAYVTSPYALEFQTDKAVMLIDSVRINGSWYRDVQQLGDTHFFVQGTIPLPEEIQIFIPLTTDMYGEMIEEVTYIFSNDLMHLADIRILNERELMLRFTDYINPVTGIFADTYEVNGRKVGGVEIEETGYETRLKLQKDLTLGDSIILKIGKISSASGKVNQEIIFRSFYTDRISELWVQQPQLVQLIHEVPLDLSHAFEGDFEFLEESIAVEAWVNESHPEQVQLVLEAPLPSDRVLWLRIPARLGQNGEWIAGSLRPVRWDNHPPQLQEIEVLQPNEFLLHFDEAIDPVLAVVPVFYTIEDIHPVEAVRGAAPHQVLLVFEEDFPLVDSLTIRITQIEDLNRNAVAEIIQTFSFQPPLAPAYRELVINEIMPSPRADGSLPNVEYIELYNTTTAPFHLGGLRLGNSRTTTTLPPETIGPKEYLILCPATQVDAFKPYGKVLGVQQWPTLLNAGDEVWLLGRDGTVIDRLAYDNSTFGSNSLAQGGYSLEVVNPYHPCETPANIRPSIANAKGTPGKINSVFDDTPDRIPPRLERATPLDSDELRLSFSKPIVLHSLSLSPITFSPHLDILEVRLDSLEANAIVVKLALPFSQNQVYEVRVQDWRDCAGNLIDPQAAAYSFKIPGKARPGDVVLNEVLFNPRTGGSKFVEIYNASDQYIDLKNWKLANVVNGEIANRREISGEHLIIDPFHFLVFTTDPEALTQHYPKGNSDRFYRISLPSYPVGSGSVVLLNPEEDIVEQFDYHERFHHNLLREARGVSLERYSLEDDVNDPQNWHSASATEGYATPGYRNSQTYDLGVLESGIQISPLVFVPDAAGEQPFTTISYKMDQTGFLATLRIYSTNGLLIRELCRNEIWGSSGFYTWDGTDEKRAKVKSGYYIVWVELFHPDGKVGQIKKTVVVGTKF